MAFNLRLRFNGIFSVILILLDFEHRRLWTDALRRRPTAGAVPANRATSMQCSDRADEDAVGGLGRWLAETGPQLGQTADSDEAGRGFRSEAGRRSDVKPAALSRSEGGRERRRPPRGSWWMIRIVMGMGSSRWRLVLAQAVAGEFNSICIVNQAVEHRIGEKAVGFGSTRSQQHGDGVSWGVRVLYPLAGGSRAARRSWIRRTNAPACVAMLMMCRDPVRGHSGNSRSPA